MYRSVILIAVLGAIVALVPLAATGGDGMVMGCGTNCTDCHSLSREEAIGLLKGSSMAPADALVDEISIMETVGLWKVTLDVPGEKPLYIDFGKKNVFVGEFYPLRQPLFEDAAGPDLIKGE